MRLQGIFAPPNSNDLVGVALQSAASCAIALMISIGAPSIASADEDGLSFWLPGLFGSLAAVPQQPGFSLASIYYHTSLSAGADVALAREITIGKVPVEANARAVASLSADGNIVLFLPSYVFATPILGGQAAVALMAPVGQSNASIAGSLTGTLSTPFGTLPFARSANVGNSVVGIGDLYPQAFLRWNMGLSNFMTYATGDIPIGTYGRGNLANIGIGHGAIDGGLGYTYFDQKEGHEFSGVLGFTYNLINPSTNYQNGVDLHFDWAASQFLTKQIQVGAVGYVYKEIGCDSGAGDRVGCFRSQVFGAGPQAGYIFPVADMQGYLNVKGYKEFDARDRPAGWNVWVTLSLSPAPAEQAPARQ